MLFCPHKNISAQRFHIDADKYNVIQLCILKYHSKMVDLYDGPIQLSKNLKLFEIPNNMTIYLTFQCVVTVWKYSRDWKSSTISYSNISVSQYVCVQYAQMKPFTLLFQK